MSLQSASGFLSGVIEGFYGPPWSPAERARLFDGMVAWGLNTYLYAPKDDLKHRALWRESYDAAELAGLGALIQSCRARGLNFIYALSPGLDIGYSNASDRARLQERFQQIAALGCGNFALLFDDIPDRMSEADARRWGSFAAAQCHVTNELFRWTRECAPRGRFLFCPTPYCGRMAAGHAGGRDYLETVGRELDREIEVFWTGPEIISREITVAHARELQAVLRRKPLIWDNLHANDYDGRRFFCGPYAGRPLELREEVSGVLVNPNTEFPLNFVPWRTFGQFVQAPAGATWEPRAAYRAAMREWLAEFASIGKPISYEELVEFGDCFYLPYEDGAEAAALLSTLRRLAMTNPAAWGAEAATFRKQAGRLRDFCARMTELRERSLFSALSRRVWELREEMDLLDRYVAFRSTPGQSTARFGSDFHLPGTYRGGLVARLQQFLEPQPDGDFLMHVPENQPIE